MEIKHRCDLIKLVEHFNLPKIAAECGVAQGLNSRDLLQSGFEKLYSVDAWRSLPNLKGDGASIQQWHDRNLEIAQELMKPFGSKSVFLRGLTYEMAKEVEDKTLGLVYIDGDHSYEGAMKDLVAWFPKVVDGGIISGHDYLNMSYSVNDVVKDFCRDKYEIHVIPEHKDEDASFWFRKPLN